MYVLVSHTSQKNELVGEWQPIADIRPDLATHLSEERPPDVYCIREGMESCESARSIGNLEGGGNPMLSGGHPAPLQKIRVSYVPPQCRHE